MLKDYLKHYRRVNQLNIEQMSKKVGVSYLTYYRWEKGSLPSYKTSKKLANVLHISMEELIKMYEDE